MDGATVYINKSYFRRAYGSLIVWPLDSNYCRVRITVKTHRNKLSATLHIVADLASTNVSIFDRPTLRRSIPLGSLRETALSSRRRGENYSTIVHCLTLRRQTNPLLSGAVVNLYQECRLEIDKIYSCLTALRQPLCVFLDMKSRDDNKGNNGNNSWIVRLLNNLTVQSLGLCPDYLYVLHVAQEFFELQDVDQASILSCRMSRVANCSSLNGWFFVQFAGCLSDVDSIDSPDGGYLAMQCARSSQLLQLFQRLLGLSFGHRRWPSAPSLDQAQQLSISEASGGGGLSPRREASFNAHRPRSATNRRRLVASPSSPSPSPSGSPSPMASPRRLVGRFSFFRRQQQQQKPYRSPSSVPPQRQQLQQQQKRLQLPQERSSHSQLSRHQSSSSVLSFTGAQGEQPLEGNLTSSSAATSSSSISDSSSSCRSAASVASLSALDGCRRNFSASTAKRHRRQLQQLKSAEKRSHKRLLSNEMN